MLLPFVQITSFVVSILVLIIFLTICIICRYRSSRRKKIGKPHLHGNNNGSSHQFNGNAGGPPIYYKYSPANSMDYLGNV
jgi:hypothetical protein